MLATVIAVASELSILLSVVLLLPMEYGRDQGTYAVVAREMQHGAVPYRDVFDHKPPGIHLLFYFARLMAGDGHWGIRVIEAAFMLATVAGLIVLAERHGSSRRVGLVAGALYCLMLVRQDFWHTAQPESFSGALIVWGLVCASWGHASESQRTRLVAWILCGVSFGVSGLLKPPPAVIGPVLAAGSAWTMWRRTRSKAAVVPMAAVLVGLFIPVGVTAAWFAYHGGLASLIDALFVFTPPFTRIYWSQHHPLSDWLLIIDRVDQWVFLRSTLAALGVALLAIYRPSTAERPLVIALLLSGAILVLGVVAQAKFYASHWNSFFPILALLGALGLAHGARVAVEAGPRGVAAAVALVLLVVTLHPDASTANWDFALIRKVGVLFDIARGKTKPQDGLSVLASIDNDFPTRSRLAAEYLANRLPPGAPIFVWGFEPNLYEESHASLASRYIYNLPLRAEWYEARARETLMADLKVRPASAIIVSHADPVPYLVGNDDDSAQALEQFPQLKALIASEYDLDAHIGPLDVYVKKGLPPAAD